MAHIKYNPNPNSSNVGDCVIRALTLALNTDWESAYVMLVIQGFKLADMPSANHVWGSLLMHNGFKRYILPNDMPERYTIEQFASDHPEGMYIVATGTHVVTIIDGDYYDSWESGHEVPIYYFTKQEVNHA